MTIRQDESIEALFSIDNLSDRIAVRKAMLRLFMDEDCKTKLRYYVETLADGKRIYIERPGRLNKGCDFVILVEDLITWGNGNDKAPSHDDLINDLKEKKAFLDQNSFEAILQAITDIYEVRDFNQAYSHINNLPNIGWSYELVLKLARWLFIEQDMTYWARSGREMLYNAIIAI